VFKAKSSFLGSGLPYLDKDQLMIQRYVVVLKEKGKIFLSATRSEFDDESGYKILDVLLPMDVHTKTLERIHLMELLAREGSESYKIPELQREILRGLAHYAKNEKDRTWLHEFGREL